MACLPGAGAQIGFQSVHGAVDVVGGECGEHGDPRSDARVQTRGRTTPERAVEPVGAVTRDRRRD